MKIKSFVKSSRFFFYFSFGFFLLVLPAFISGQSTFSTNTRPSIPAYLGWNASGIPGSLDFRNDFSGSYPLNFFTGGNSTTNQRMTILGSAGNGYVGIGSGFSTPQALLHINGYANAGNTGEVFRSSGPDDNLNAWQMYLNPLRIEAFE